MQSPPTHTENCRRVTDWKVSADGKTRERWVYDPREEAWDQEIEPCQKQH